MAQFSLLEIWEGRALQCSCLCENVGAENFPRALCWETKHIKNRHIFLVRIIKKNAATDEVSTFASLTCVQRANP